MVVSGRDSFCFLLVAVDELISFATFFLYCLLLHNPSSIQTQLPEDVELLSHRDFSRPTLVFSWDSTSWLASWFYSWRHSILTRHMVQLSRCSNVQIVYSVVIKSCNLNSPHELMRLIFYYCPLNSLALYVFMNVKQHCVTSPWPFTVRGGLLTSVCACARAQVCVRMCEYVCILQFLNLIFVLLFFSQSI